MGIVDNMSKEFEKAYMETLRRRHGTKRVNANNVYQEVIQDKHHIHMNATKWATLTDYCQYLGKTGQCVVEETERGWYVQYIERDASILARQEAQQRRVEAEKESEQRLAKQMEIQRVEAAKALDRAGGTLHTEATKLDRSGDGAAVSLSLGNAATKKKSLNTKSTGAKRKSVLDDDDEDDDEDESAGVKDADPSSSLPVPSRWGAKSARDGQARPKDSKDNQSMRAANQDSRKRQRTDSQDEVRKENWVCRNIMVRIISKKLAGGKYYKRKAIVDRVMDDKFTAEVEVLDSGPDVRDGGDVLRLDQEDLETVVPKEGKSVRVVNGRWRGKRATLLSVDKKKYRATLELEDGTRLERVDYEDFSKVA